MSDNTSGVSEPRRYLTQHVVAAADVREGDLVRFGGRWHVVAQVFGDTEGSLRYYDGNSDDDTLEARATAVQRHYAVRGRGDGIMFQPTNGDVSGIPAYQAAYAMVWWGEQTGVVTYTALELDEDTFDGSERDPLYVVVNSAHPLTILAHDAEVPA